MGLSDKIPGWNAESRGKRWTARAAWIFALLFVVSAFGGTGSEDAQDEDADPLEETSGTGDGGGARDATPATGTGESEGPETATPPDDSTGGTSGGSDADATTTDGSGADASADGSEDGTTGSDGDATGSGGEGAPTTDSEEATTPTSGALRVHYVDVEQGDGTIWQLPDGSVIVYDCGTPSGGERVVRSLHDLGYGPGSSLHALVVSHGHLDHAAGCTEVLEAFEVKHVYDAWYEGADVTDAYARFQDAARAEGARMHVLHDAPTLDGERVIRAGDRILLPQPAADAGVHAELLWPPRAHQEGWDSIAESSLVVRLVHGDVSYCFQGDIEAAQERAILDSGADVGCDVYLVGHHGSRYASSSAWLDALGPDVAVVSYGDNPYGHPTPDALCRVQSAGASVHTTHKSGTITVASDGARVSVTPQEPLTQDYCASGGSSSTDSGEGTGSGTSGSEDDSSGSTGESSGSGVTITETHPDAAGTERENLNDEYVRITNDGDAAVDLSGWTLRDEAEHAYAFPSGFTLDPGASVTVRTGSGTDSVTDLYWGRGSPVWNNGGDSAILHDADGNEIDRATW